MKNRWHIKKSDGAVILSRHVSPRFDVQAQTVLAKGDPLRLAHQIRQDVWRCLQNMRGFSPVVLVEMRPNDVKITAGDALRGASPQMPSIRSPRFWSTQTTGARWIRHANRKGGSE